jgi:lipoate-protein ligase A
MIKGVKKLFLGALAASDKLDIINTKLNQMTFDLASRADISVLGPKIVAYLYRVNSIDALDALTKVTKSNIKRMQQEILHDTKIVDDPAVSRRITITEISIEEHEKWLVEIAAKKIEDLYDNTVLLRELNFTSPDEFIDFIDTWHIYETLKLRSDVLTNVKSSKDLIESIQCQIKALPVELENVRHRLNTQFIEYNTKLLDNLYLLRTKFARTPSEVRTKITEDAGEFFSELETITKFEETLRRNRFYVTFVYIMENFDNDDAQKDTNK